MNDENTKTDTATSDELITIAGGVEIEVTHTDGSKETVKVRQILISKIQQFALAIGFGDEAEAIMLYCDKPKEWADTLTVDSVSAIADKGLEINRPFFGAWSRRQAKWRETFGPVAEDANKTGKVSPSASSAPQSPTTTSAIPGT